MTVCKSQSETGSPRLFGQGIAACLIFEILARSPSANDTRVNNTDQQFPPIRGQRNRFRPAGVNFTALASRLKPPGSACRGLR